MTEQTDREQALAAVRRTLEDADLEHEGGARDGELVVTLPGEKKLKTVVSLVVGEQALSVSAFVIRNADENHEEFYRHLLRRNLRIPLLAYSIDASGDVYVGGRIPLRAVTEELVDQVLGVVLDAADAPFNELLLLGFRSSMQKEWDWRVSRGESLRNLEAFRSVLEHTDGSTPE
ncbi:YbjN domain-containing protein [Janibacter indicus]|uniref:YbjN domain-containing protein n=1 Tax=Janibacter indicus TaxID=857417 RepID=A0A7L9J1L9_9MICO|nr:MULTISPECIES: YbjN domain-containing protein [Janibacter]QNF94531.1 YbjN domain-containing protein [Janibacter sp. YB324]QOK23152.1 YbjN domain-containing protein [Janibacter indicus]